MKPQRFWIEIIIVGSAVACALALLIATLGAFAGAAVGAFEHSQTKAAAPETFEGMVTCSRCGARHHADLGQTAAACVRICVHGGATFTLVDGDKTYVLVGDPELLKKVAGQRTRIEGLATGNTIRVTSMAATAALVRPR
jgi:hypothetical protein